MQARNRSLRHLRTTTGVLVLLYCLGAASARSASPASDTPQRVALVALVADPDRYNGKIVEVTAWGFIAFEGGALYLTPSDKEYYVAESAVFLELVEGAGFPSSAEGYMTVEGRFQTGRRRGWAGTLTEIRQLHVLKPRGPENPSQ